MKRVYLIVDFTQDGKIQGNACITTDQFIAHTLALGFNAEHREKKETAKTEVEAWDLVESLDDLRRYEREVYRKGLEELKKNLPAAAAALYSPEVTLTDMEIEFLIRGLQKIKSSN